MGLDRGQRRGQVNRAVVEAVRQQGQVGRVLVPAQVRRFPDLLGVSRREPARKRAAQPAAAAVAAGVRGFLVWDSPAQFLTDAVRQVAVGRQVADPRLSFGERCPLTTREADALRVAAEGSTTAEIATVLCLSEGTVRNYLSRAIAKTGARNRVGAIRIAGESGWL